MRIAPRMVVDTRVDEWKVAQVGERAIFLRVWIRRVADEEGRFGGATLTPFAVVVADAAGSTVLSIPGVDAGPTPSES